MLNHPGDCVTDPVYWRIQDAVCKELPPKVKIPKVKIAAYYLQLEVMSTFAASDMVLSGLREEFPYGNDL